MLGRKSAGKRADVATGDQIDQLKLSSVALLTSTDKGPVTVPGLGLVFDSSGMTVEKASGEVVKVLPWHSLSGFGSEDPESPGGGVVLNVKTDGRSHRFVVPLHDKARLERDLARVADHYRAATADPPPAAKARPSQAVSAPYSSPGSPASPRSAPTVPLAQAARPQAASEARLQAPSEAGAIASSRPKRKSRAAKRRVKTAVVTLIVNGVIVAILAGLYFAQKEGVIHFLPKSIVQPSNTPAPPPAPSQVILSPSRPATVPGLSVSQVLSVVAGQGFSCTSAGLGLECNRPAKDAFVNIGLQPDGTVGLVSATYLGNPSTPAAAALFDTVASLPYQGAVPAEAVTWVNEHRGLTARTVIGGGQFSMLGLNSRNVLQLVGAS